MNIRSPLDMFCERFAKQPTTNNKSGVWDDYAIHTNFACGADCLYCWDERRQEPITRD